jgi:D-lactate dehydrogenase
MCFFSPTTDALTPLRSHATPDRSATVHPTCSMHTLGNDTSLRRIAAQLATSLSIRSRAPCCAFAGDRGSLHEELTRSATHDEAWEVMHEDIDRYICANRTCEASMEHATRAPYESFVYSLEKLTRT